MEFDRLCALVASFFGEPRLLSEETTDDGARTYVFAVPWSEIAGRRVRASVRDGRVVLVLDPAGGAVREVAAAAEKTAETRLSPGPLLAV